MSRLTAVRTEEIPDPDAQQIEARKAEAVEMQGVAIRMMNMALAALSQRAVVAISSLFTLLTAASAFYLWMIALPTLDVLKIVGLSIYSLFVLALNIFGRRK